MWYLLLRRAVKPRDEWTVSLDQHLVWMKQQHESGKILFSGPTTDRKYGVYVIRAGSKDEAEKMRAEAESHAYDAARIAREKHQELILGDRSFVAETVFSHPSKVDLMRTAKEHGYVVWLTFIYLESDDLAVARVRDRVEQGGHNVPVEKIRDRYGRLPEMVKEAMRLADKTFVVDNSYMGRALRDVLVFDRGHLIYRTADLPGWTRRVFDEILSP